MQPTNTGTETNIKLPFLFIFFSLGAFAVSQFLFLMNGATIIDATFRLPSIWATVHLFILGWLLMLAMGAMYQLVPVAFLTIIWSETFGFIQFAVMAIGVITFAIALYIAPHNALIPGIITVIGILMFLFQMGMTLKKQAKADILTLFVGTALICLLLAISLGISLVYSLKTGTLSNVYDEIFFNHLLLGTAGWFTLLIFGFSYKMVPMFSLAHGFPMHISQYVYGTYIAGLVTTIIASTYHLPAMQTVGLLLLFSGFVLFACHMWLVIKNRMKKKLDRPFIFSLIAIIWGGIIHLLAFIANLFQIFHQLVGPLLYLYILMWIAFSIIGYLYKIVPFLWWTHKYSKEIGKKDVPVLKDLMNEKAVFPLFFLFTITGLFIGCAFVLKAKLLFYIAQGTMLVVTIIYCLLIIQVIRK